MADKYRSIMDDPTLDTPEKKQAERDSRSAKRIEWINTEVSGLSVQQRLDRLEALILGYIEKPGP